MKKIQGIFLFIILLFCTSIFAAVAPFKQIVFFGDSLTDNGNLYHLIKIIPQSPPYYQGRFSNGPTWAEDVGKYYYDKYSIATLNYSYGGATSIIHSLMTDKFPAPITLDAELFSYHLNSILVDKSKVLYVFWIGANDYLWDKTPNVNELTDEVVNKISSAISTLIGEGANKFMILNMPDLAKTPYATMTQTGDRLHIIAVMHNKKLNDKIKELQNRYPTIKFVTLDVYEKLNDLLANPDKYNQQYHQSLQNFTQSCLSGGIVLNASATEQAGINDDLKKAFTQDNKQVPENFDTQAFSHYVLNSPGLAQAYKLGKSARFGATTVCTNANQYVFWDDLHPTEAVHQIFGQMVVEKLTEAGEG